MVKRLRNKAKPVNDTPFVSEDRISTLCKLLQKNIQEEKINNRYVSVKQVLTFIGLAGVIGLTFMAPSGGAILGKLILNKQRDDERKDYRKFNEYYLHRALKRLHSQKYVEITEKGNVQTVTLTSLGRHRIFKYSLDNLSLSKPKHWDGRWRLIIYDVNERKKHLRDVFRGTLKSLGFYKLQESTWIYPYPCEDHVTFLREYYGVGNEVLYIVANKLENDLPYREYFGLT